METIKIISVRGSWVAPSVKHKTFDFNSGHDLTVLFLGSNPTSHSVLTVRSMLGILSAPPCVLSVSLSLSLSTINKHLKNKNVNK